MSIIGKKLMRSSIFLLLFSLSNFCSSLAEVITLKGKVIDSITNAPIAFATIGIRGKTIGSVADENGNINFQLNDAEIDVTSEFIISCIGYKEVKISVNSFREKYQTIKLSPSATALNQVLVKPKKVKLKTFGNTSKTKFFSVPFYTAQETVNDDLGREIGRNIKIEGNCLLRTFNFYNHWNDFKSVTCRLNIYDVNDGGSPRNSLLTKDIIFKISQQNPGWITLDLSKYHLHFEKHESVFVTMQWLKSEKLNEKSRWFNISANLSPFHTVVKRDKSQDTWKEIKGANISFYLRGEVYK
jgi:hypothetical protein